MKRNTILVVFLGFFIFSCKTPSAGLPNLFSDFRSAAQKNDEVRLKELTLDFIIGKPKVNLQDGIIKGVLTKREKGDFAYSDKAIQCLLKKYLSKFQPISEVEFQKIAAEYKFSEHPIFKELKYTDILRIEQGAAKVIVLRLEEGYKLFYWRDLNSLIP